MNRYSWIMGDLRTARDRDVRAREARPVRCWSDDPARAPGTRARPGGRPNLACEPLTLCGPAASSRSRRPDPDRRASQPAREYHAVLRAGMSLLYAVARAALALGSTTRPSCDCNCLADRRSSRPRPCGAPSAPRLPASTCREDRRARREVDADVGGAARRRDRDDSDRGDLSERTSSACAATSRGWPWPSRRGRFARVRLSEDDPDQGLRKVPITDGRGRVALVVNDREESCHRAIDGRITSAREKVISIADRGRC